MTSWLKVEPVLVTQFPVSQPPVWHAQLTMNTVIELSVVGPPAKAMWSPIWSVEYACMPMLGTLTGIGLGIAS